MFEQGAQIPFVVHVHFQPSIAAHDYLGMGIFSLGKVLCETASPKM